MNRNVSDSNACGFRIGRAGDNVRRARGGTVRRPHDWSTEAELHQAAVPAGAPRPLFPSPRARGGGCAAKGWTLKVPARYRRATGAGLGRATQGDRVRPRARTGAQRPEWEAAQHKGGPFSVPARDYVLSVS